jgi:hypothetical protein
MGWSLGYDSSWHRDIGYGVPAYCDHPKCKRVIDRGLSYVCGNEPYGGERGCGLYFCGDHQQDGYQRCERCAKRSKKGPFDARPDHPRWMKHKLKHASWQKWRDENPKEVEAIKAALKSPLDK